jgi:DNA-binding response OmpR family regulator
MTNRIKLLVVDNEVRFLNTLTKRLSPRDFDVTAASSGQETLELAGGQDFDLVLLDLETPGTGAAETLRVIEQRHPLTEVVILTRKGSVESVVEGARSGSYIHLRKPAETTELLRVLKDAYLRRMQRKLSLSEEKLLEIIDPSANESPLFVIRKLKELDASR